MKKNFKSIIAIVALLGTFLIPGQRAEAKAAAMQKDLIDGTKETTPLVLQHAKDLQNKNFLELAWHYSHSSHVSHASHASHSSHYSHYSSSW